MKVVIKKEEREKFIKRFTDCYFTLRSSPNGGQNLYLEKDTVEEWLEHNLITLEGELVEEMCPISNCNKMLKEHAPFPFNEPTKEKPQKIELLETAYYTELPEMLVVLNLFKDKINEIIKALDNQP